MARRNPALSVLDGQLKVKFPGIVIGWIGDPKHAERPSDHNPDSDGTVDALDPMIGNKFTAQQAETVVANLVQSRDKRIGYIIWQGRIISSTVSPWVWRPYNGDDPHRGHFHISSRQEYETETYAWKIDRVPTKLKYEKFSVNMPVIPYGTSDADYDGWNMINRIQDLRGIPADGIFGPQTRDALKTMGFKGDVIDMAVYRAVLGLATP